MIVVVDSGVWISALQFEGTPLVAIERILMRHATAICEPMTHEIRSGLGRKFGWSQKEVEEAFDFYLPKALHVEVHNSLRGICRDSKDDMVLECAIAAQASAIVTGDKDLLALSEYNSIRIFTPRAFLDEFSG